MGKKVEVLRNTWTDMVESEVPVVGQQCFSSARASGTVLKSMRPMS